MYRFRQLRNDRDFMFIIWLTNGERGNPMTKGITKNRQHGGWDYNNNGNKKTFRLELIT